MAAADGRRATVVVGIPIDSESLVAGCNLAPQALREAGLVTALNARDAGDLPALMTDKRRDPETGIIGYEQLLSASRVVMDGMAPLLAGDDLVVVAGGCCALLFGVMAAVRKRHGRTGLAFVDGHLDFHDGTSSPTGSAADTDLAVLTGHGPAALTGLAGPAPLVEPRDAWVLGYRDHEESLQFKSPDPLVVIPEARFYDAASVREQGPTAIGTEAATALSADPGRYWVHVDLDVLSSRTLPAVDYWQPGGLDWEELRDLLTPLVRSPRCIGLDLAIYNPALDPRRKHAPEIVDLVRQVVRG